MTNEAHIRTAIREVLARQFAGVDIVSVNLAESLDHDGDEILRVEVVFRSVGDKLDPIKVKGLVRHLRSVLADQHEDRFPVITYLTTKDIAERKAAAH
jgi:hypothetical protein